VRGKHRPRSEQAESEGRRPAPDLGTTSPSAYEILQIQPGCSGNEIRAAYHRLAKMYHLDQVRNLGPEFRELAERRMKEINVAYGELEHLCNQPGSERGE
jgi:DnaJ-class molecular chaperone